MDRCIERNIDLLNELGCYKLPVASSQCARRRVSHQEI